MNGESVGCTIRKVKSQLRLSHLVSGMLLMLAAWPGAAQVIYDNSVNDLGRRFDLRGLEAGDQIVLAGSARYCTNFSFEYWGDSVTPGVFAGTVEARVRFYRNDGALYHGYATPGTMFYDSGSFVVEPTLRNSVIFLQGSDFPAGGLYIPANDFTWSVQFQGLGAGDAAGVDLYSPITSGLGYDDYWENDLGGGWALKTNANSVMNFAAKMEARAGAPPPAPILQLAYAPGQLTLAWPATATSFVLETSPALGPEAAWTRITDGILISGGNFVVNRTTTGPSQFFRLHQQ